MRKLAVALSLLLLSSHAWALDVAGVNVAPTVSVHQKTLALNGAGIRKKLFIKVYVGSLYTERKVTTPAQLLAESGAPGGNAGIPYPDLNRKHRVHPILKPGRDQPVNLPIAVKRDHIDPVGVGKRRNPAVMRANFLVEKFRADQRSGLVADVLPEMGEVKVVVASQDGLRSLVAQVSGCFDHLLHQIRVIGHLLERLHARLVKQLTEAVVARHTSLAVAQNVDRGLRASTIGFQRADQKLETGIALRARDFRAVSVEQAGLVRAYDYDAKNFLTQERQPDRGAVTSFIEVLNQNGEVVMSFRLRMAVAQSGSPLQAYDQDTWAGALYYDKADCRDKLKSFSTLRGANVTLLKCLSPKEWQRYGMHEERGKETIERMVQMLAGHDVNHLRQIAEIRQNLLRAQH